MTRPATGTPGRAGRRPGPTEAGGVRRGLVLVAATGGALVLVAGTLAGLVALAPAAPRPPAAPDLEVPDAAGEECRRGAGDPAAVAARRAELVPAAPVRAADVRACPRAYDGLTVTLVGEVVGDLVRRDGGAWLTVNDDAYALAHGPLVGQGTRAGTNVGLAVWAPDGTHERLGGPGRAGRRGDLVRVVGTVRRADPEDGGGLTLRATTLEVLAPSVAVPAPVNLPQAALAATALAAALEGLRRRLVAQHRDGRPRRRWGLTAGR